ncbi:MAG: MCE family protein [Nitrosomonadales bacterium]|nr:MCE family protein [Nitrosomonadales bacterium]
MESKVSFAAVGVFVLLLGAALIGSVLWLSSSESYGKTYDTYLVYMSESVSGLNLDSPVRYRGVQVGRVRHIALAPDNIEQVQLTLDIERGTPVKVDTVAMLQVQGLTGIAHINLVGGSRDSLSLKPGPDRKYPVISTGPSLMMRLDSAVTTLLGNLNRSSENVNALLDEQNRVALRHTLANLERLSNTLANAELPQLLRRLQHSADAFDRMAKEVERAGASTANTAESVRAEALPEARQAIAELRELTASLRRFSEELERNPGMLLQGQPGIPPGPGE